MEIMKTGQKQIKWMLIGIYSIITVVSFFTFFFDWDVRQTAASSYALLQGHIMDFYDYNFSIEGLAKGTIYEILIYIIYAIWNLPLFILGVRTDGAQMPLFAAYWNKLILAFVMYLCAFIIYKIAQELKHDHKVSKMIAVTWCTIPLLFFLIVIQGSYDIYYVLFMLLGLWYWLKPDNKKNNILFNIWFGLAICIKPFPLFYYLILLLIKEKNIFKIIVNGIVMILPYALCKGLYLNSEGYQAVLAFNGNNLGSLFFNSLNYLIPFILVYFFACAKAYWSEEENPMEAFYLCNMATFAFIGFSSYHPQWIMGAIPFWILSMFYNKKKIGYLLVIFIITVAYYVLFGLQPDVHVNQDMLFLLTNKGLGDLEQPVTTIDKFYMIDDIRLPYSVVSACTFILAFFSQKQYCNLAVNNNDKTEYKSLGCWQIAVFVIGVFAYIVPALLCWFPPGFLERTVIGKDVETNIPDTTTSWVDETGYQQAIYVSEDVYATDLECFVYTWDKQYDEEDCLYFSLKDENDNLIAKSSLSLDSVNDTMAVFKINSELYGNRWYTICFEGSSNNEEDLAALGIYNDYDASVMNMSRNNTDCNCSLAMNLKGKPLH